MSNQRVVHFFVHFTVLFVFILWQILLFLQYWSQNSGSRVDHRRQWALLLVTIIIEMLLFYVGDKYDTYEKMTNCDKYPVHTW